MKKLLTPIMFMLLLTMFLLWGGETKEVKAVTYIPGNHNGHTFEYLPKRDTVCEGVKLTQHLYCNNCRISYYDITNSTTGTKSHVYATGYCNQSEIDGKECNVLVTARRRCNNCLQGIAVGTVRGGKHTLGGTPTESKKANCLEAGYDIYSCPCGANKRTDSHPVDKTNHKNPHFRLVETTATCCKPGKKEWICECKEVTGTEPYNETISGNVNHEGGTERRVTTIASCSSMGVSHLYCKGCGDIIPYSAMPIAKDDNNHVNPTADSVTIEPTCCKDGEVKYYCSCGKYTSSITLPKTNKHDYSIVDIVVTCTQNGRNKCSNPECSATKVIIAPGHEKTHLLDRVEATCQKEGYEMWECGKCHTNFKETLKRKSCMYKWVTAKEPTCTSDGVKSLECSMCHHIVSSLPIPKLGHCYEVVQEKTCTKDGIKKCVNPGCKSQIIEKAEGHVKDHSIGYTPSTCKSYGYFTNICKNCHEIYTEINYAEAKKHNYTRTDCSQDLRCSYCGLIAESTKEAHHNMIIDVAATCTKTGKKKCTNKDCQHTEVIPATGHTRDMSVHLTLPNGPEKKYVHMAKCITCGAFYSLPHHLIYQQMDNDQHRCVCEDECAEIPGGGYNVVEKCTYELLAENVDDNGCTKVTRSMYKCKYCGNKKAEEKYEHYKHNDNIQIGFGLEYGNLQKHHVWCDDPHCVATEARHVFVINDIDNPLAEINCAVCGASLMQANMDCYNVPIAAGGTYNIGDALGFMDSPLDDLLSSAIEDATLTILNNVENLIVEGDLEDAPIYINDPSSSVYGFVCIGRDSNGKPIFKGPFLNVGQLNNYLLNSYRTITIEKDN